MFSQMYGLLCFVLTIQGKILCRITWCQFISLTNVLLSYSTQSVSILYSRFCFISPQYILNARFASEFLTRFI